MRKAPPRRSIAVVVLFLALDGAPAASPRPDNPYEIPQESIKGSKAPLSAALQPRDRVLIDDAILVDGATELVVVLRPFGGALELLDGVGGTVKLVREYPSKGPTLGDPRLFRFAVGAGDQIGVIFEYVHNQGTPVYEQSKTYLETFVFEKGALISATEPVMIAMHDSGPTIGAQPKYQYYSAKTNGPGIIEDGRVLLRDVNADGFMDLVLWQRRSECRPIEAAGGNDGYPFDLKSDTKTVMLYDPVRKTFDPPKKVDGLPATMPELWDKLDAPGNIKDQSRVRTEHDGGLA